MESKKNRKAKRDIQVLTQSYHPMEATGEWFSFSIVRTNRRRKNEDNEKPLWHQETKDHIKEAFSNLEERLFVKGGTV